MDHSQTSVSLLGLAAVFAGGTLRLIHTILDLLAAMPLLWLSVAHISDTHLRRQVNAGRELLGIGNLVVQSLI